MKDREGATHLVKGRASKRVKKIWADMGYRSKELKDFMKSKGKDLEIVLRPRRWNSGDSRADRSRRYPCHAIIYSVTQKMDCGENFCLDLSVQKNE